MRNVGKHQYISWKWMLETNYAKLVIHHLTSNLLTWVSSRSYLLFVWSCMITHVSLLFLYWFIWLCQVLRHLGSYFPASVLSCFSHVQIFGTPWTVICQVPLFMGFSRKENWSGLLCPLLGDLPDSCQELTELMCLMSPVLPGRFFTTNVTWEAQGSN